MAEAGVGGCAVGAEVVAGDYGNIDERGWVGGGAVGEGEGMLIGNRRSKTLALLDRELKC
jgi:hypothetical protein